MISQRRLFLDHLAQTSETPLMLEVEKAEGLIKCNNDQVDRLKSELDDQDSPIFTIMGVSGTIKTARQKFLSDY